MSGERPTLLVFGAGSLACEVVRQLTAQAGHPGEAPLKIVLASRDGARAQDIALVALAQAHALGNKVAVEPVVHDWESPSKTRRLIARFAPQLIFHVASLQSAWDMRGRWGRFVAQHGYGVTLPLQLPLAFHLQEALGGLAAPPSWINACFPDLANACLAANSSGPPPNCGVGNVALIAQLLSLHVPGTDALRVIAAHSQLSLFQRERRADEPLPLAWLGAQAVDPAMLVSLPALPQGQILNAFNAVEAARLIWALLTGRSLKTHAPGPKGLPGGYPVLADGGEITLDLADVIDLEAAIARNRSELARDGALLEDKHVRFTPPITETFGKVAPPLAHGFALDELASAARAMLTLRSAWSSEP